MLAAKKLAGVASQVILKNSLKTGNETHKRGSILALKFQDMSQEGQNSMNANSVYKSSTAVLRIYHAILFTEVANNAQDDLSYSLIAKLHLTIIASSGVWAIPEEVTTLHN